MFEARRSRARAGRPDCSAGGYSRADRGGGTRLPIGWSGRGNSSLCINYGGRDEIKNAVRAIAQQVKAGELAPEDITEDTITANLYTAHMPDPDLIIRPSGEIRTSNFLLWQSAYSEYYFTDVLWPDFKTTDLDAAIDNFNNRNRRFGGV